MTKTKIIVAYADKIEFGVFTVMARAADGRWLQHEGPKGFAFFTEKEANDMVDRVKNAGQVNEQFWIDGTGGYYGTDAHEYALMELEYYER